MKGLKTKNTFSSKNKFVKLEQWCAIAFNLKDDRWSMRFIGLIDPECLEKGETAKFITTGVMTNSILDSTSHQITTKSGKTYLLPADKEGLLDEETTEYMEHIRNRARAKGIRTALIRDVQKLGKPVLL